MKFILHLNTIVARHGTVIQSVPSCTNSDILVGVFFFKIVNVLAGTYILTNYTVIYVPGSSVRSILFRNIHISV